jgi:hypothetical protein
MNISSIIAPINCAILKSRSKENVLLFFMGKDSLAGYCRMVGKLFPASVYITLQTQ